MERRHFWLGPCPTWQRFACLGVVLAANAVYAAVFVRNPGPDLSALTEPGFWFALFFLTCMPFIAYPILVHTRVFVALLLPGALIATLWTSASVEHASHRSSTAALGFLIL